MFKYINSPHYHQSLLRRLALLALFLGFLLAVLLYRHLSSKNENSNGNRIVETTSGRELAREAFKFLEVLNRSERIIEGVRCETNDKCTSIESVNPTAAITWQILANAKLYAASNDSHYKKDIEKLFESLGKRHSSLAFPLQIEINLSQVLEGIKASRNYELLKLVAPYLQDIRSEVNTKGSLAVLAKGTMASALIAGELADFYNLLENAEILSFLKTYWLPKNYSDVDIQSYRDSFKVASKKILREMHAEGTAILKDRVVIPITKQQDFSCFVQLAKSKLYLGTKDPELLSELFEYFEKASFKSKDTKDFRYNVMQPALACAEALKNIIHQKSLLNEDLRSLVSNFILTRFDYSKRPICVGDNGFLGSMGEGFSCKGTLKLISDSAWAVSILSDLDMHFDIKSKRIANHVEGFTD